MGLAILPLHLKDIARALQIPDDYQIVSVQYDMAQQSLLFLVASDAIPDTREYAPLPRMNLLVKVEAGVGFHKVTVTPTITGGI